MPGSRDHVPCEFLENRECALIDQAGEIEAEYRRYLNPQGQPGVGDRFYQEILRNANLLERIELPKHANGEYADLPQPVAASTFDRDDRKFAALAKREAVPVVNAVDSDWLDEITLLTASDIEVEFLCGCNRRNWFER